MSSYGAYRMMHALHEARRPKTVIQAPEPAAPTYAPAAATQAPDPAAQPGPSGGMAPSQPTDPAAQPSPGGMAPSQPPYPAAQTGPTPLMTPEPPAQPRYSFLKSVLKRHNEIVQGEDS